MNLSIAKTTLQSFDYQPPNVKVAILQRLAPKQELSFAHFVQYLDWDEVLNCHLAKYSKALALMDYFHFLEVINSFKFIYKTSKVIREKALFYKACNRLLFLVKTTVKL